MTSLLVVAVVVLLPLVTPLQRCKTSTTTRFLTKTGVNGGILANFYQNHFWNVASAGLGFYVNEVATEINFAKPNKNQIDAFFDHRKSGFDVVKQTFTLNGKNAHYVDVNKSERVFFFQCAGNFVGGYRCLTNAQSEKSDDPDCFIWADWKMQEKDVTRAALALADCESAFKGVPNCATFTRSYRSDKH